MVSTSLTAHGVAPRPIAPNNTGRLRYANAEDLPSYPSAGLTEGSAAASAAATLGWANRKPTEVWKPNSNITSTSASTAALLAAGNKTSPLGRENHPVSTAGSQAAVAASSAQRQQKSPSSPPSVWVSSAANLAFNANKPPPPTITVSNAAAITPEPSTLARQNSMHAAKGAMSGLRPRAKSTPQPVAQDSYPDQANAASNALSAATMAHRPTLSESGGAVPYTTMDRRMFTSNPPVKMEVEEQQRADVLHASAVAMAKRMYNQQQRRNDDSTKTHARSSSFPRHDPARSLDAYEEPPVVYNNLQEAAYRLAQERLAKLQEEHQKNRDMSEYYGTPGAPNRSKFGTIRGKLTRKRSSSDGDLLEDQRRSQHIRKQMSMLNSKLSDVDEEKRTKDRQALLAAAQRNVRAQLHDMDEKVMAEKGGVPPKSMGDWERKALVAAQTRFDENNTYYSQKIDIGGGKFMDKSEVDAIAARKVQPLLDEINERAEREKVRLEEERLEEERRREGAEKQRLREKEIQDIHKKLKDQQKEDEKARKAELKEEDKRRKEEIKAIKAEHKQAAKEGKLKEKEVVVPPPRTSTEEAAEEAPTQPSSETEDRQPTTSHRHALSISFPRRKKTARETTPTPEKSPKSDSESHGKVRNWLLSRLPRPRAKSSSAAEGPIDPNAAKKGGFIGGAALARLAHHNSSSPSVAASNQLLPSDRPNTSGADNLRTSSSMHEVAMAGRPEPHDEVGEASGLNPPRAPVRPVTPTRTISQVSVPVSDVSERTVSSLSSSDDGHAVDKFVEARSQLGSPLTPPRTLGGRLGVPVAGSNGRSSPLGRESRFSENLE
ncbi:hypothetical protein QBC40DRAFT_274356 [Triangularia verruculosa]|uniref:Eisosome protein 1 n=1 Tax=Triangularia verruculosa TaxID=2587418 RepID=A0AAN6XU27_9PEZI|nr:hypothetical protein QBC40DRAFT_274356 [Triangularia verruculosa]